MSKDYRSFFGLSGPAFNKQIPAEAIYRYPHLEELHYYLAAAVADGAVAVVTGPVGAGKSTALRAFLTNLDPLRYVVIYVGYTSSDRALFREVAHGLGLSPSYLKGDLLNQLHGAIEHAWLGKQRSTLLVVDDAHLLADSLLTELRQMLNFQMDSATPLGLLLVGQPTLAARLKESQHEALSQRTLIRYTLAGLSRSETSEYGRAHMLAVDGDPDVFTAEAVDLAFQQAKGIPREIGNLCVYALIRAAWQEVRSVDRKVMGEVIQAQKGP
ncbi:MAG: AAA family ATPase [Candidatus Sericytochromatia bacterium]|nr:AAA family ATPase [Candidatus Sericytochromatia bacterium]